MQRVSFIIPFMIARSLGMHPIEHFKQTISILGSAGLNTSEGLQENLQTFATYPFRQQGIALFCPQQLWERFRHEPTFYIKANQKKKITT